MLASIPVIKLTLIVDMFAKDELRYVAFTVCMVALVPMKLFAVAVEKLPVELLIVLHTILDAFTLTGLNTVVVKLDILADKTDRLFTLILSTLTVVVV